MAERMTFFRSYLEGIEGFEDKIQLEVLKAILRFGLYGEEPEGLSPVAKLAFTYARPSLEKSAHKAEVSVNNGNKGGRPRKDNPEETQKNPEKPSETQQEPKKTSDYRHKTIDIDIDKDNMTVDKDLKDLDIEGQKRGDFVSKRKEEVEAVLQAWNSIPNIPSVRVLDHNTERYKMLCARLDKYGVDAVIEAINNIKYSSFLCGQGDRGWKIDFSWFVKPNNFPKVLEGKYTDGAVADSNNTISRTKSVIDAWLQGVEEGKYK